MRRNDRGLIAASWQTFHFLPFQSGKPFVTEANFYLHNGSPFDHFTLQTGIRGRFWKGVAGKFQTMRHKFQTIGHMFATSSGEFRSLVGKFKTLRGKFKTLHGKLRTLRGKFRSLSGKFKTLGQSFELTSYS